MKKRVLTLIIICTHALLLMAQETPNEKQARRIFNIAYNQVFGEQGASLTYDVNIIGIYRTQGTIWFKGNKQKFVDERVNTWNDGKTAYMAYRKKKTVEVHAANSDKKDKYSSKFKFQPDDFTYHISKEKDALLLTLKQKKKAKGSIKEVKAWVDQKTFAPKRLRIKVAFVWTTVNISNFRSGGITDDLFVFPREKFKGWKFVDKR
ncbi:MAG: hypothetical protein K6G32_01545 [Prevotella sp.]|nr:hypothetical protein [Prevotella sp.]